MQQQSISQLDCDLWQKKRKGFYMTTNKDQIFSGMDGEEAPKYFPKSTLNQKKKKQGVSWLLFGGLLLVWSIAAFWIQAKLNWWDAPKTATAASICQQNGPNSSPWKCPTTCCTSNASKVEWIGLQSFASSTIFTWPLDNWLPLLQASR